MAAMANTPSKAVRVMVAMAGEWGDAGDKRARAREGPGALRGVRGERGAWRDVDIVGGAVDWWIQSLMAVLK